MAGAVRLFEIDFIDFQKSEVTLAFFRGTDLTFNRVTGTVIEFPHLARRNVNIVRTRTAGNSPREAQEAKAIRQHFQNTFTGDVIINLFPHAFQNGKQHILFAHRAGALNIMLFRYGKELGGSFRL